VGVVPEFGGDEQFTAGNAGLGNSLSDLLLIAIDECSINVTISGFDGDLDGGLDDIALALPGSQATR